MGPIHRGAIVELVLDEGGSHTCLTPSPPPSTEVNAKLYVVLTFTIRLLGLLAKIMCILSIPFPRES